jgi:hypothetical protein
MNKQFWKASLIRAIRTIAQTAVSLIGTAVVMSDVNWSVVVSASILSGILSILTAIATGLPEVEYAEHIYMSREEPADSYIDESEVGNGEE